MGAVIERRQDDNATLAYWLTNTVTLLHLLQKNVKPAPGGAYAARLRASPSAAARSFFGGKAGGAFTSFFARATAAASSPGGAAASPPGGGGGGVVGGDASIHAGGAGGFRAVEAKYPALLFKQQLDAFVQKIFPMLRDNVKKEVAPSLAACVHAPRAAGGARAAARARGAASPDRTASSYSSLSPHWGAVLGAFDRLLATLTAASVPSFLVRALFRQLFAFVDVQLFNQLLLRRECCSFSNGEYVKTGLAEVEAWIGRAGPEAVGGAWEELRHVRQAVTFLVIHQKHRKTLDEITADLCPVLSVQQLYRISTMYWDDRYGTETVSHGVLAAMKSAMVDAAAGGAASHSFLLDDDSSIPFTADDVAAGVDDAGLYGDVPIPPALAEGDSFAFLARDLRKAPPSLPAATSSPGGPPRGTPPSGAPPRPPLATPQ